MELGELLLIVADYQYRLKYLPTGVKQLLISQLLLHPFLITKMNDFCETDIFINELICQNLNIYKMLWP